MAEIIRVVDSVARAAGVSIASKEPRPPVNHDYYEEIPLKITVDGSFSEITMFLYYIASVERIMKVKGFTISEVPSFGGRQRDLKSGLAKLQCDGQVVSYRFIGDKKEAPKK